MKCVGSILGKSSRSLCSIISTLSLSHNDLCRIPGICPCHSSLRAFAFILLCPRLSQMLLLLTSTLYSHYFSINPFLTHVFKTTCPLDLLFLTAPIIVFNCTYFFLYCSSPHRIYDPEKTIIFNYFANQCIADTLNTD